MAAVGRESRLMPTVKCSTCGLQVEISLMGEHECTGSGSPPLGSTPPMPATSLFGRLMPTFGNPLAQKQPPRAPPQVDTSAANRAYMGQGQLTPISGSSGSQSSVSPQTPIGRLDTGKADDYFLQIANNSPPPSQSTRSGGYGGLDEQNGYEDSGSRASPPKKQQPSFMDRMNSVNNTADPFGRRPSAAGPGRRPSDANDRRPSTSASNISSGLGSGRAPRPQRPNGYGGFGAPAKGPESAGEPPMTPNRSDTFPRPSDRFAPPPRTPSAPPASATLRPDQQRLQPNSPGGSDERIPMTSERTRRPSRGPDTSRPPPPRTGVVRPTTPGVPTINLAQEFGIGNPYHAPSESSSSDNSENSSQPQRRPSQASQTSQASSRTSPPRSLASRSGRNPSDTSGFDNLMSDIQSSMSMDDMKPNRPAVSPLKLPPRDAWDRTSPLSPRPPRTGDRGYDPRIDPAIQNPRPARGRSPIPTPISTGPFLQSPEDALTIQTPNPDALSPNTAALPSPRWTSSPERINNNPSRRPSHSANIRPPPPSNDNNSYNNPTRRPSNSTNTRPPPPSNTNDNYPTRTLSRSRSHSGDISPLPSTNPPSSTRGNCKACSLPIKGKSIASADGRLTGRYHKPCFVCSTCSEPFTSSTFYVHEDRPYCELHYHKLNGSLCGGCGRGIEGQYLEDEAGAKHHVGCFRCGECNAVLRDGYFEVGGRVCCERDAWRLMNGGGGEQRVAPPGGGGMGIGGGGLRPPVMGLPGGPRMGGGMGGGYNPSRLGPGMMGARPKMEKRMTRLGMM